MIGRTLRVRIRESLASLSIYLGLSTSLQCWSVLGRSELRTRSLAFVDSSVATSNRCCFVGSSNSVATAVERAGCHLERLVRPIGDYPDAATAAVVSCQCYGTKVDRFRL